VTDRHLELRRQAERQCERIRGWWLEAKRELDSLPASEYQLIKCERQPAKAPSYPNRIILIIRSRRNGMTFINVVNDQGEPVAMASSLSPDEIRDICWRFWPQIRAVSRKE